MKQALIQADEIKNMRKALECITSPYLKRDYEKAIARKIRELKEYCGYRGINYKVLKL